MINIQILFSGIIAGIIIFHTSVVAPLVFKKLEAPFISLFLRALFPKFFIMIFVLSLANFISSMIFGGGCISNMMHLASFILSFMCYLLIGVTNKATDNGDKKQFKLLHRISVFSTVIVLIINLIIPFIFM